jgi:hypothetical protein
LREVAEGVVEHAAAAATPTPRQRTIRAAAGRAESHQDVDMGSRIVLEDVELLVDSEARRERSSGGSTAVLDDEPFGARQWVVAELSSDQPEVAGPVVKGVRRGVSRAATRARASTADGIDA